MNKRQAKKKNKKNDLWVGLDTTPFRCRYCANYESGDESVGIMDGCVGDYLYDENGNFQEDRNDKAVYYMSLKGWTCPYFCRNQKAKDYTLKAPKSYKEIRERIRAEKEYEKLIDNV